MQSEKPVATVYTEETAWRFNLVNLEDYADLHGIMEKYHAMVVQEIKEEARLRSLKEEAI